MDMEWNQALTFSEMVKDPVFLTGEIIQIRAINDARSTALLCTHLDLIRGLNEYKETVENRNGIVESYEFEEPYADIGDALSDDYVVSFECPHCGEIVWGENWIRKMGTNLLSLAQCSDGQEYLINIADLICARRTQWRLERRIP